MRITLTILATTLGLALSTTALAGDHEAKAAEATEETPAVEAAPPETPVAAKASIESMTGEEPEASETEPAETE